MNHLRIYQADAFTDVPFAGNPAGVVLEADGLTDADMQGIARELGNPETAFFFRAEDESHDLRVRYFSPEVEVPLCGHATIAAHYIRATLLGLEPGIVRMKTNVGILPVAIRRVDGDYDIVMTQSRPEIVRNLTDAEITSVLAALGLTGNDLDDLPVQIATTGGPKVMLPLRRRERLHALRPDFPALRGLSLRLGVPGYYLFTFDTDRPDVLLHGRMFAPALGINEDPVTGMANGALGAYLAHHYRLNPSDGTAVFRVIQGEAMGRPGIIRVEVDMPHGRPETVRIGGRAIIVFTAELNRALLRRPMARVIYTPPPR